ncbi:MAG: 1,6-anhydro-N-acetylmuramyl-L-alanine amidase AmpD [Pseudomonadales bacterium]|nr:1,6-anhydro-N-acetylmuramyl-L-alanine amidase AmpD [Pseudomonadales bacterium]
MQVKNHWLEGAHACPCPNHDERPEAEISLLVIHCISLPEGHFGTPYVEGLFCNTLDCHAHPDFVDLVDLRVSSHLFVPRDGSVVQFVPFDRRAWHAGTSSFRGREACNDFSIGIELEGTDHNGYREEQYRTLKEVVRQLVATYDIRPDCIVGHSDIAPGRKTDPGPGFDWSRLIDAVSG